MRTAMQRCLLIALCVGCAPDAQTIVTVRASAYALGRAERVRVRVVREDGEWALDRTLLLRGHEAAVVFPMTIPLTALGNESTRRWTLSAELFDADPATVAPFNTVVAHGGYVEERVMALTIAFDDACADLAPCPDGQTCRAGECVGACYDLAPYDPMGPPPPTDPTCTTCEVCDRGCQPAPTTECGCPGDRCVTSGDRTVCDVAQPVQAVAGGHDFTCALTEDSRLYCFGDDRFGQLGLSEARPRPCADYGDCTADRPVQAVGTWSAVAAGGLAQGAGQGSHVCAIGDHRAPRELSCWGGNAYAQAGQPSARSVLVTPERVGLDDDWAQVALGGLHSCGRRADRLFCWGTSGQGQAGREGPSDGLTEVGPGVRWASVCAGNLTSCALSDDGDIYCWGNNFEGQIAGFEATSTAAPVRLEGLPDGRFVTLACGAVVVCAIHESGELYCWGADANQGGQLGRAGTDNAPGPVEAEGPFRSVDCGGRHCCAITVDRRMACWGSNVYGQVGTSAELNDDPLLPSFVHGDDWDTVSTGRDHACAIRVDGSLYCWGRADSGRLGIGPRSAPQAFPSRVCIPSP